MPSPRVVLVLVAAALLAAGCTQARDDGTGSGQLPDRGEGPWPLTGLPGYSDDNTDQVIAVKVDNTRAGQPQLGIGEADLVVQEMVEGGVTRLAALYHSTYPQEVEPVRSLRATDSGIVLPTGGTLASSGGEQSTIRGLEALGVPLAMEGDPGFSRAEDRRAPYNLVLDVGELGATLPPGRPPGPYLPFGDVPTDLATKSVGSVTLTWPAATTRFDYDPETEQWSLAGTTDPEPLSVTTVLALELPVEFTSGKDAAGTPIPTMLTEGSGRATLATEGGVSRVQWQKPSASSPWTFTYEPDPATTDSSGAEQLPLTIPPGRTWVGLLPVDGGSVSTTKRKPAASPAP